MKTLLDFLPAIAFIAGYYWGDIYTATAVLIGSLFVVVLAYWLIEKRLHKGHLTAAIAAAILGGITLAVHDPYFIKLKPSVVYGLFALALLGSHVVGTKVLLQRIPQKVIQMPDVLWRKVNVAWALFFVFCAVLNYYVAFHFNEATWVKLKAFGFTALMFVFLLLHLPFLSRYLAVEKSDADK
jgi:intracellular septation protein